MDDSCAVCAEPLEWVAYGACGHRDVCSTCVARLRFICSDRRCCICKSESSVVFVTKALGDYTRMINDFSVLPSEVKEGKMGSYWYHDDTQAFFDDVDHYRMIKAMCRLSCSECDKMVEQQSSDGPKHKPKFKNIGQLKGHLFHQHKLSMCGLCLEGRKIFICEQKLYTKTQLKKHTHTGDAEVDGSESERGGFMGHPSCEFCKTPFYGDNELYTHMNAAHYTCHICQRQHPGQYEYYKNYDGLEMHFRRDHFLCEDETCLAQKFVVFQSEAEIKRHNAKEHGGRMSRSKRNAALQIPTSFSYRSNNAQAPRRGRGRGQMFRPEPSDYQLSMAIEASLESSNADNPPSPPRTHTPSDFRDTEEIDPIVQPFEALTTDSESAARYLQAVGQSYRSGSLQESAFPPLPGAASSSQQKSKHESESFGHNSRNAPLHGSSFPPLSTASSSTQPKPKQESEGTTTMATKLSHKNNKNRTTPNSAQGWSATGRGSALPVSNPNQPRPTAKVAPVAAASPSSSGGTIASSYASYAQARPETMSGLQSIGSLRSSGLSTRIGHSASSPNLAGNRSTGPSASDFPPVSAAQLHKTLPRVQDVQTANKSLVESIRSALDFDEEKYTTFKDVSGKYRQGLIDTESYLDYVINFGLSHLVIDLARLCPDPEKQKELVDTYNSSLKMAALQEDSRGPGVFHLKNGNNNSRGKGKHIIAEKQVVNPKDLLADNIISTVRKLQSNYKPSLEEEEVLSKDGYRAAKGKSGVVVNELQKIESSSSATSSGSDQSSGRKKTPKFHRISLGGGSLHLDPDPADGKSNGGVWGKAGGQKLFSGGSMGRS